MTVPAPRRATRPQQGGAARRDKVPGRSVAFRRVSCTWCERAGSCLAVREAGQGRAGAVRGPPRGAPPPPCRRSKWRRWVRLDPCDVCVLCCVRCLVVSGVWLRPGCWQACPCGARDSSSLSVSLSPWYVNSNPESDSVEVSWAVPLSWAHLFHPPGGLPDPASHTIIRGYRKACTAKAPIENI